MDNYKESVTKLEWRVDGHDSEINLLKQSSSELKATLETIIMTLKQIKWIAVGAGAIFFSEQIGLMGALKLAAL